MPRWLVALIIGGSVVASACADEPVEEDVSKDVCYTGKRWVGERRGSPNMFPGRDCVGCHIENDGPPLAVGGTLYPYVLQPGSPGLAAQTGTDCFGVEGVTITIEDANGQQFEVVTNEAGNFFVEGNPDDWDKPFNAFVSWTNPATGVSQETAMFTTPSYGGCGRCHNPGAEAIPPGDGVNPDVVLFPTARMGLPGYGPGADGYETIQDELDAMGCEIDPTNSRCD